LSTRSGVEDIIAAVQGEYAADPRLSVFEVEVVESASTLIVAGVTSDPAAAMALHAKLAALEGVRVEDRVVRLPEDPDAADAHAVVTAAIAPMLAGPMVAEIHLSQALLGHRLIVLRRHRRWLQCRAQDGYIGWLHRGYLVRMDEPTARAWDMGSGGEACFSLGAEVLDDNGDVTARLPWGARAVVREPGTVTLPDGTSGSVRGELVTETERAERFPLDGAAIIQTAARWTGSPYLWGGTTPAGVDCSGLAQAIYRTHGLELPRDSDLQAEVGEAIEPDDDFSDLLPGDLLFFAEEPGRVTHVIISTGGSGIIHSSLGNGGVRRNDLMGAAHYEEELRRIFVCARRVIPG
jgi:hypothetical protein